MPYCVVCWRAHALLCCLLESSCLIVLFVGGLMPYCVVCWRAHALLCCLLESSCLIVLFVGGFMPYCVVCVCLRIMVSDIFSIICRYVLARGCDVRYEFLIKTSLPQVACRRANALFMLLVFVSA
jgi:hypothetical protein